MLELSSDDCLVVCHDHFRILNHREEGVVGVVDTVEWLEAVLRFDHQSQPAGANLGPNAPPLAPDSHCGRLMTRQRLEFEDREDEIAPAVCGRFNVDMIENGVWL